MSDTPETDAAFYVNDRIFDRVDRDQWQDFARKLERQRDEAREKYDTLAVENMLEVNKLCKERDEAREENAKLRDIAEMAIKAISSSEYGEFSYTSAVLRAELDQLKEGAK